MTDSIESIYAEVPVLSCKGLCHACCGPILMSAAEKERIAQSIGYVPKTTCINCPLLNGDNRCQAYEVRPLICRLWGAVKKMQCPHGCIPVGGFLPEQKSRELIKRMQSIGGQPVAFLL